MADRRGFGEEAFASTQTLSGLQLYPKVEDRDMQDTRPVRRRRGRPPGPPRTAVNGDALRWVLRGWLAGAMWNSRQLAEYTGVPKQRISDVLTGTRIPLAEDVLTLMALVDISAAEVMMAAPAEAAEPEPASNAA